MIELEIIQSPDSDRLGALQSFASKLSFGKGREADVVISDPTLLPLHIELSLVGEQLRAIPQENRPYWLGGKKTLGQKNLKRGDTLKIGETTLKILTFAPGPWAPPPAKSIEEKVQFIAESDQPRGQILQVLREELLFLDQEEEYVSKDSL